MYSKSIEDVNRNYFSTMCPEIFEKIIAPLPYNPNLANLSMTSKELQRQVLETSCGEYVKELNALTPSYLRAFFAKDYGFASFCIGGSYLGMATGAYLNYETFLSTYLGAVAGTIVGGAISSSIGGYIIEGFNGAKNGISCYTSFLNPMPLTKLIMKTEFACIDAVVSFGAQRKLTPFQNIIKEQPKELLDEYLIACRRSLSLFKESNRTFEYNLEKNVSEKKEQLSHPLARNGI
ncbi:MAG: hypothetical protein H0T84_05215 [Tatlockia sp.]|nr:hypothetical protein [Tatlockia sp.]